MMPSGSCGGSRATSQTTNPPQRIGLAAYPVRKRGNPLVEGAGPCRAVLLGPCVLESQCIETIHDGSVPFRITSRGLAHAALTQPDQHRSPPMMRSANWRISSHPPRRSYATNATVAPDVRSRRRCFTRRGRSGVRPTAIGRPHRTPSAETYVQSYLGSDPSNRMGSRATTPG
jgi:hypothetical protein